jgi:hypothetical protein
MRKTPFLIVAMIAAVVGFGCERGAPAPKAAEHDHAKHQHDHAAHGAEAAPKEPPAPAGPRIETGAFLLAMAPAQTKYTVGKPGEVEIALEGRGEWHVNQEYPIRIDVTAPDAAGLEKRELLKDDAAEFGEKKVRFLAPVAPSAAGEHEVTCDVSFAMCTDENCVLERRTVAMQLEVK